MSIKTVTIYSFLKVTQTHNMSFPQQYVPNEVILPVIIQENDDKFM